MLSFNFVSRYYRIRGFSMSRMSYFKGIFNRFISIGTPSRFTVILLMTSIYTPYFSKVDCINSGFRLPYILSVVLSIASDFSFICSLYTDICHKKPAATAPAVSASQSKTSTERLGVNSWWNSSDMP